MVEYRNINITGQDGLFCDPVERWARLPLLLPRHRGSSRLTHTKLIIHRPRHRDTAVASNLCSRAAGYSAIAPNAGDSVRIVREAQLAHSGDEDITQLRNDS